MGTQKVIILGATGSIGETSLNIIRRFRENFKVVGISYHSNHEKASSVIREFSVPHVYCSNGSDPVSPAGTQIHQSYESLLNIDYDTVIVAVVGSAGVTPTFHAALQGKRILLANKESLVMAGRIIIDAARKNAATILPVDSEHNSLFRLLESVGNYQHLTITASGGALREFPLEKLEDVAIRDVLNHPTWNMGAKITVDSATMVNKALEIIEAHHLFNKEYSELDAVVHPESYVHAILQHADGSSFFHVYKPDMTYSIAFCLFYPDIPPRLAGFTGPTSMPALTFYDIDKGRYPGYYLGLQAGKQEGAFPAVFNAANEQAVAGFLENQIRYVDIAVLISGALDQCAKRDFDESLEGLFAADAWAREYVKGCVR